MGCLTGYNWMGLFSNVWEIRRLTLGQGQVKFWNFGTWRPLVADPSDRPVNGVDLLPFGCWVCGFEFRRRDRCLSLVSVVCCYVRVNASSWSLVRRSPIECGVSECDREAWTMRRLWSTRDSCAMVGRGETSSWHVPTAAVFRPSS